MPGLCQGCLCQLEQPGPDKLPLCASCYDELLGLPIDARMARIAALTSNGLWLTAIQEFTRVRGELERTRRFDDLFGPN